MYPVLSLWLPSLDTDPYAEFCSSIIQKQLLPRILNVHLHIKIREQAAISLSHALPEEITQEILAYGLDGPKDVIARLSNDSLDISSLLTRMIEHEVEHLGRGLFKGPSQGRAHLVTQDQVRLPSRLRAFPEVLAKRWSDSRLPTWALSGPSVFSILYATPLDLGEDEALGMGRWVGRLVEEVESLSIGRMDIFTGWLALFQSMHAIPLADDTIIRDILYEKLQKSRVPRVRANACIALSGKMMIHEGLDGLHG